MRVTKMALGKIKAGAKGTLGSLHSSMVRMEGFAFATSNTTSTSENEFWSMAVRKVVFMVV